MNNVCLFYDSPALLLRPISLRADDRLFKGVKTLLANFFVSYSKVSIKNKKGRLPQIYIKKRKNT